MNTQMSRVLFVLINGMWEGPSCWDFIKQKLESFGCNCVALNLKYHDGNTVNPHENLGKTGILDYVIDLEEKINLLRTENQELEIVLIGHSMGGLLAQILMTRNPNDYYSGIFLTPAPPSGTNAFQLSVLKCFYEVFNLKYWNKPFKLSEEKFVYAMYQGIEETRQKEIIQNLQYESWKALSEIAFWPIDKIVRFFQGKGFRASTFVDFNLPHRVLFVGAQNDNITPAKVVMRTAARYSEAIYREVPNAPHYILENEETVNIILSFMRSSPSSKICSEPIENFGFGYDPIASPA